MKEQNNLKVKEQNKQSKLITKLKADCKNFNVMFPEKLSDESQKDYNLKLKKVTRKIRNMKHRNKKEKTKGNAKISSDVDLNIEPVVQVENSAQNENPQFVASNHANPEVLNNAKAFEAGEENHKIATCKVCKETRPVFHVSYDEKAADVRINPWKLDGKSICSRCKVDRRKRTKSGINRPAKFSGSYSEEIDLGPSSDLLRENNMHFKPIPPYLQNLTAVETALISKITVCTNVHMLRYGMLASKGHSISIPQRMAIAKKLPLLPENVNILILRRKGSNDVSKHYSVQRYKVEEAIKGLCYGLPNGGYEHEQPNTYKYLGPDHMNKLLNGRYFYFFPNEYYSDIEIQHDRLQRLPLDSIQCPGLKVIDTDEISEQEKGPAPEQFQVPFSEDDESFTVSGVTLPMEPKDADFEIQSIIKKLIGDNQHQPVALSEWEYADGEPLSELKTPGFFSMSFPTIFINGSCDITHNPLVNIDYHEWVEHIYFQGDGRVTKHPYLKFFLYNLGLRMKALKQGSYLVAQQLNEAHISIDELKERVENDDQSIPRKIIKMSGNLPNTDPYWMNRRQELEAFTFFRRNEVGDLPAYFHTNSMAEIHWIPLIKLLSKYIASTDSKNACDIESSKTYCKLCMQRCCFN